MPVPYRAVLRFGRPEIPAHRSLAEQNPAENFAVSSFFRNFVIRYHLKPTIYAAKNHTGHGGGKSQYLTPEITILELAVERGFAASAQLLDDIGYDDSWESANQ